MGPGRRADLGAASVRRTSDSTAMCAGYGYSTAVNLRRPVNLVRILTPRD
jgi:hypothetical protein